LVLAWRPLNALLDTFVWNSELPWALTRLELLSPEDSEVIAYELVLPHRNGVRIGPLGGIDQAAPFAAYDAIYREAILSSSPFYRLLCAFRIYDGTTEIRRWLREQCEQHHIAERMPADPEVDATELRGLGYEAELVNGIRRTRDLFERFREHRNAIAHFLVEGELRLFYAAHLALEFDQVIALGGKEYRSVVEEAFKDCGVNLTFPFSGLTVGRAMRAVKRDLASRGGVSP
jgi:hypothetical protein